MDWIELVNDFNNGDESIVDYFGGYENFFKILKKKKLLHLIDPRGGRNYEYWQNEFLLFLFNEDLPRLQKYLSENVFSDVEFYNDVPYLEIGSRGELSVLFSHTNREISQETIESILDGEYNNDYYGYVDNIYDDVINAFSMKKYRNRFDYLQKYFVDKLKTVEVYPETKLLSNIAEEQNQDYVSVDSNNIVSIFRDRNSVNYILNEYLEELKSELSNLYNSASNNAYESELYGDIMSELSEYFTEGEWVQRISQNPNNKYYYRTKIEGFWQIIRNFLLENSGYTNLLEYYSYYLDMLKETIEPIRYYPPDYPDFDLVVSNMNDIFDDYVN